MLVSIHNSWFQRLGSAPQIIDQQHAPAFAVSVQNPEIAGTYWRHVIGICGMFDIQRIKNPAQLDHRDYRARQSPIRGIVNLAQDADKCRFPVPTSPVTAISGARVVPVFKDREGTYAPGSERKSGSGDSENGLSEAECSQ
jgi:hypothetical protein